MSEDKGASRKSFVVQLLVHPACVTSEFMFRALATPIILHPNGWTKWGYNFKVEVAKQKGVRSSLRKQIVIQLTPQDVMDKLFPGFESERLSVCNMRTREIFINESRWRRDYADDKSQMSLPAYRCYVLNHEIGHALGRLHERCKGTGQRAPIMLQQTVGLHGCLPDPFP